MGQFLQACNIRMVELNLGKLFKSGQFLQTPSRSHTCGQPKHGKILETGQFPHLAVRGNIGKEYLQSKRYGRVGQLSLRKPSKLKTRQALIRRFPNSCIWIILFPSDILGTEFLIGGNRGGIDFLGSGFLILTNRERCHRVRSKRLTPRVFLRNHFMGFLESSIAGRRESFAAPIDDYLLNGSLPLPRGLVLP